jgi:hypothetical protein
MILCFKQRNQGGDKAFAGCKERRLGIHLLWVGHRNLQRPLMRAVGLALVTHVSDGMSVASPGSALRKIAS